MKSILSILNLRLFAVALCVGWAALLTGCATTRKPVEPALEFALAEALAEPAPPPAAEVKIEWDSSLVDLGGKLLSGTPIYKLFYGEAPGAYTEFVAAGTGTSANVTGLAYETTYYFAARAYAEGNESAYSEELAWTSHEWPLLPDGSPRLFIDGPTVRFLAYIRDPSKPDVYQLAWSPSMLRPFKIVRRVPADNKWVKHKEPGKTGFYKLKPAGAEG